MKSLLVTVALLAGIANSQIPKPCVTPPRWEAKASFFETYSGKLSHVKHIYDAIMQRRVLYTNILNHHGRERFKYIRLYDVWPTVSYRINLETNGCTKYRGTPWRPVAIPPEATFKTEYDIGYPGEDFTAQEWMIKDVNQKVVLWRGVYSLKYCFPIIETFYDPANKTVAFTTNYYDVVAGISNPKEFIPPKVCKDAVYIDEKPPVHIF